jgi:hypothetical protein
MKNKSIRIFIIIITITFLSLLAKTNVSASPGPQGIAINSETKQCANYWPGDEFTEYNLPEGWESYYPDYDEQEQKNGTCIKGVGECLNKFQIIINTIPEEYCYDSKEVCENLLYSWGTFSALNTETGKCYFNGYNAKSCCAELGYKFVSDISKEKVIWHNLYLLPLTIQWNYLPTIFKILIPLILVAIVIFVITFIIRKKRHLRSEIKIDKTDSGNMI